MTAFNDFEVSREASRPIELYSFAQGTQTFTYTSAEDTITIGAVSYTPLAISRGKVVQSSENRKSTMVVTMPGTNAFASKYKNIVPAQKATLSIFRYQRDESPAFDTQILVWKGEVQSVRYPDNGTIAEVALRSLEAAASREIPRYTCGGMCGHVLYSPDCGVAQASFTVTGAATAATGNVVTVTGANAQADGFWTGGYAKPAGSSDFRVILAHTGNDLTLLLPFAEDPVGTNIQIFAGCDHTITGDCATKFDNVLEFGGFAFVPTRNPFQTGIDE